MTDSITWHKLMLEDGRAVLSGRTSSAPGTGVWVATVESTDGGQTTQEVIAVDGKWVHERRCCCGADRASIYRTALTYFPSKKARRL